MTSDLFLAAAGKARLLLDHPELERRWREPSALDRMSIGGLTAHLSRAVTLVPRYLASPGKSPLRDGPGYFVHLMEGPEDDLDEDLATEVRVRADQEAEAGPADVRRRWDEAVRRLETDLGAESATRPIAVRGSSMAVADYLVTRLVELVIHADDLAASLRTEPPEFAPETTDVVIGCLVEIARRRASPLALIRFMSRRERSEGDPLRVF